MAVCEFSEDFLLTGSLVSGCQCKVCVRFKAVVLRSLLNVHGPIVLSNIDIADNVAKGEKVNGNSSLGMGGAYEESSIPTYTTPRSSLQSLYEL